MFINELYNSKKPVISLEVFPPKKESSIDSIISILDKVTDIKPDFISVTYGASGNLKSTKYSQKIASLIENQHDITSLFHLTCINNSKEQITSILSSLKEENIQNILALRGDIPEGATLEHDYFKYATDLISFIKNYGSFCVGAACYPEGHIDETEGKDIDVLKKKQDLGADFFISQLFFENRFFLDFREDAIKAGITKPLVAGIMPILSKKQVDRMIYMCGVSLPAQIVKLLHKYENNPDDLRKAGIEYAISQAQQLISHGVEGIHVYTMNHPEIAGLAMNRLRG